MKLKFVGFGNVFFVLTMRNSSINPVKKAVLILLICCMPIMKLSLASVPGEAGDEIEDTEGKNFIQEFYESGHVKYEGYINDGLKEGYWKYFFEDGRVRKHGEYLEGTKAYWWEEFYFNGRLKSEGMYLNGEKDHFWVFYDDKGFKQLFGRYDHGKKVGIWKKYMNGILQTEIDYTN